MNLKFRGQYITVNFSKGNSIMFLRTRLVDKFQLKPIQIAVMSLSALVFAQQSLAQSAAGNNSEPQLEKVTVTANKRVEALETVPMAISVVSKENLERNNVLQFDDIVNIVPTLSVTYGSTPANNGINMRGIGTYSNGIGVEADVSVVIDDIPIGQQFQAFQGLATLDRIEVLQGPQSTLYGKSSIAGAVNVITKQISETPHGEMSVYKTNDRENRLSTTYSTRVDEHWSYRISGASNNYAGNVTNIYDNSPVNGTNSKTLMAKIRWQPTDKVDIELSPRYNNSMDNCCVYVPTGITAANGASLNNIYWQGVTGLPASKLFAGVPIGPGNATVNENYPTGIMSTARGTGLKATMYMDDGSTLMSISSQSRYQANDYRDQDFTASNILGALVNTPVSNPAPSGGFTQQGTYDIQTTTQEFRLTSPESGKLKYVAGVWYADNKTTRNFTRGVQNVLTSATGTNPTSPTGYEGIIHTNNQAFFGQASYEFLPTYSILVGGRAGRETDGASMNFYAPWQPSASSPTASLLSPDSSQSATTGKVSLSHDLSKSSMAYVLFSTGYKGRAYDLTSTTVSLAPTSPETAKNIEIGYKGNFLNNRLTFNASAWDTKFSNYQQQFSQTNILGIYSTVLASIPGAETKGAAFDVNALVTPRFLVNASAAFTNATITSWENGPCGAGNSAAYSSCNPITVTSAGKATTQYVQNLTGAPMANAPRVKFNLGGQYDILLSDRPYNAFVNANIRYQSKIITNINQEASFSVDPISITNVGFGIKDRANTYKLTVFVNNLFDKQYAVTGFNGVGTYKTTGANTGVTTSSWTPARDAWRYLAVRLDYMF
jgi:iron complex outermembrane recepter protein